MGQEQNLRGPQNGGPHQLGSLQEDLRCNNNNNNKKYFSYHRCIHMLSAPLLAGQVGLESVKGASESLEPGEGAPLHRRTSPCHPPFLDDL